MVLGDLVQAPVFAVLMAVRLFLPRLVLWADKAVLVLVGALRVLGVQVGVVLTFSLLPEPEPLVRELMAVAERQRQAVAVGALAWLGLTLPPTLAVLAVTV